MSTKILLTYEDYLELPNDGRRYEIIQGDLYVSPSPTSRHQVVLTRLLRALADFADSRLWGIVLPAPMDVLFSPTNVNQPDILGVARERMAIIKDNYVEGAPDLVVEIVSESTRRTDKIVKLKLYSEFGVREYWVVDPIIDSVELYTPGDGGLVRAREVSSGTVESQLLSGFSIAVEHLFKRDV